MQWVPCWWHCFGVKSLTQRNLKFLLYWKREEKEEQQQQQNISIVLYSQLNDFLENFKIT